MSEPFLAEVRVMGFNFAPRGWAFCDGQILPINQNQSLYSLLGTTYGGDGRTSFALPDMRGRTPIHVGNGHREGQKSGEETHTLAGNEMPNHDHVLFGSGNQANSDTPTGRLPAKKPQVGGQEIFATSGTKTNMASGMVVNVGGGQAHDNMMPYIALNFCIALQGLFPSRN